MVKGNWERRVELAKARKAAKKSPSGLNEHDILARLRDVRAALLKQHSLSGKTVFRVWCVCRVS